LVVKTPPHGIDDDIPLGLDSHLGEAGILLVAIGIDFGRRRCRGLRVDAVAHVVQPEAVVSRENQRRSEH
jgi:hypothetical protein